jgi:hypothetical protein
VAEGKKIEDEKTVRISLLVFSPIQNSSEYLLPDTTLANKNKK